MVIVVTSKSKAIVKHENKKTGYTPTLGSDRTVMAFEEAMLRLVVSKQRKRKQLQPFQTQENATHAVLRFKIMIEYSHNSCAIYYANQKKSRIIEK